MMLLDGPQRNITRKTNNLLVDRNMGVESSLLKKMVQLHNLALCGMKHLVTIMMLPPGSTMMDLQVLFFPFFPDSLINPGLFSLLGLLSNRKWMLLLS